MSDKQKVEILITESTNGDYLINFRGSGTDLATAIACLIDDVTNKIGIDNKRFIELLSYALNVSEDDKVEVQHTGDGV